MLNRRQHLGWTAGLAAACAGLGACSGADTAPDVRFTRLDGGVTGLSALQGKVVLVNFWATSCTTCVGEMPHLVSTFQKFQAQGYETVAVAMSYDPPDFVANFVKSRQLPFTVALDHDGGVAKAFGDIRLTPTSLLIDKRGRIVKRYVGAPDFAALHQLIGELLAA
ncbi:peroxiredoxin family protein [Ideonella livida]|uniref:TlpA family protein disulfide reductase n=1 Tax=Ideonella livida TaxID=2707176 RepID=A0A7C9TKQ3_9BURK|nr:TlpA disulfide reductase family protein [Ideonella livida]NDY92658.1 TlpA family protein disulfide reductase [Ideonella livida]